MQLLYSYQYLSDHLISIDLSFFEFCHSTHPARAKVMFKKTLYKNDVQGVYREPMVVSEQALPKLRLLLPIVKNFQITFGGKLSLISSL